MQLEGGGGMAKNGEFLNGEFALIFETFAIFLHKNSFSKVQTGNILV